MGSFGPESTLTCIGRWLGQDPQTSRQYWRCRYWTEQAERLFRTRKLALDQHETHLVEELGISGMAIAVSFATAISSINYFMPTEQIMRKQSLKFPRLSQCTVSLNGPQRGLY
jgi:hypothetical protein